MTQDTQAKRILIIQMLEGWPTAAASISRATVDAYCEDVAQCSVEAVSRATKRLRAGEVDGVNMDFPPPSARVAHQARLFDEVLGSIEQPAKVLHHGITRVDFGWPRSFDLTGTTVEEMEFVMANKRLPEPGELTAISTDAERHAELPDSVRQAIGAKARTM